MLVNVVYLHMCPNGSSENKKINLDGLSRLEKIKDLRGLLEERAGVPRDLQRLFFRGKQLEDLIDVHAITKDATLFDYLISQNDTIQLFIKRDLGSGADSQDASQLPSAHNTPGTQNNASPRVANASAVESSATKAPATPARTPQARALYKVGERVEALDADN
eukprot:Opistho-2@83157